MKRSVVLLTSLVLFLFCLFSFLRILSSCKWPQEVLSWITQLNTQQAQLSFSIHSHTDSILFVETRQARDDERTNDISHITERKKSYNSTQKEASDVTITSIQGNVCSWSEGECCLKKFMKEDEFTMCLFTPSSRR